MLEVSKLSHTQLPKATQPAGGTEINIQRQAVDLESMT